MSHTILKTLLLSTAMAAVGYVQGQSVEDAKALGVKAASYVKEHGKDASAKEMNKSGGLFDKGALYVLMFDMDGVCLANPKAPGMAGQSFLNLKDPDGKLLTQDYIAQAKKGGGWSTYSWINPSTHKVQKKKSWIQKVEGTNAFTVCGVFQ